MQPRTVLREENVFQSLSEPERRMILKFLRFSARPETSGRAAESQLLISLNLANHRRLRAS